MPLPNVGRRWPSLLVAVVLLVAAAPAEAQRSVLDAQIQALNEAAVSDGMRPSFAPAYGSLREDGQTRLTRRLAAGTRYLVYGVCDTDCDDFDITVTGPDGRTVGSDVLEDDRPMVAFVAPASGEYAITASMASCDGECGYAVVILGATGSVTTAGAPASSSRCTTASAGSSLRVGGQVSGTLSASDCVRGDDTHADYHRLTLSGRTAVTITMRSGDFDAYLVLADASGGVIESDDDGAGGTNGRITRTLDAGTYHVIANSLTRSTGAYTLAVEGTAAAAQASGACALTTSRPVIEVGQTIRGSLGASSCVRGDGSYADVYRLVITRAQTVTLTMRSGAFDAYLSLRDASDALVGNDDDGAGGTDARLSARLQPGTYYIFANTLRGGDTGDYTIQVVD